jgi:hypothetical protein
VSAGVREILRRRKDVEICGQALNGQEAIEKAFELKPGVQGFVNKSQAAGMLLKSPGCRFQYENLLSELYSAMISAPESTGAGNFKCLQSTLIYFLY